VGPTVKFGSAVSSCGSSASPGHQAAPAAPFTGQQPDGCSDGDSSSFGDVRGSAHVDICLRLRVAASNCLAVAIMFSSEHDTLRSGNADVEFDLQCRVPAGDTLLEAASMASKYRTRTRNCFTL